MTSFKIGYTIDRQVYICVLFATTANAAIQSLRSEVKFDDAWLIAA